jgi:predicted metal-dependent peptidase
MNETERLMIKARTALVLSQPFFGTLALRLKLIEDATIDIAQVDGRVLRYNPDFVRGLTHAQRVGLVAHEVMHCAAGHPMRLGARDHHAFNEAADYAINPLIIAAGLELPEGALIDPAFDNLSAEEIYARRPRPPKGGGGDDDDDDQKPGDNVGGCGSFTRPSDAKDPDKPASQADAQQLEREWQGATMQAAAIAKRAGELPGSVEELIEALKAPRVDWREALKRFVTTQARQDYSWTPPNRRYIASGLYLPSLRSEKIEALVFAIDTSISMDTEAFQQAMAELNAIASDVEPDVVHVIECDTEVHDANVFEPTDYPISAVTLKGRGGTRFAPVFEHVEAHQLRPDALIYFTDLECSDFGPDPGYPVLWAATQAGTAPFGEIIRVIAD